MDGVVGEPWPSRNVEWRLLWSPDRESPVGPELARRQFHVAWWLPGKLIGLPAIRKCLRGAASPLIPESMFGSGLASRNALRFDSRSNSA